MTNHDGSTDNFSQEKAPFGFGQGVRIHSEHEQCLKQINFPAPEPCVIDPSTCAEKGFSFSIWEKQEFNVTVVFQNTVIGDIPETEHKYILSTGGDEYGHPGIAMYHKGLFKVVIVSTGAKYWYVSAPGQVFNKKWNNVGIRWDPTCGIDPSSRNLTGGLEVFVNLDRVAQSCDPHDAKPNGAVKPKLDPSELMLGCHKTQTDGTYRNFGDGAYDELAIWDYPLPSNETFFFLGGYESNFSNMSPNLLKDIIERVDLKDPSQMLATIAIINSLFKDNVEEPTEVPTSTSGIEVTSSIIADTSPTPPGPVQPNPSDKEEAAAEELRTIQEILKRILNPENIPESVSYSNAVSYLDAISTVSNLLDTKYKNKWELIQANGSAGAATLMVDLETYARTVFCRIQYTNVTEPFQIVKVSKNILFVGPKMLVEDFNAKGVGVEIPDWKDEELKNLNDPWNIYDRSAIPTGLFNDDRCNKRSMCISTMIFRSYAEVGPSPFNQALLETTSIQQVGSNVISIHIEVDNAKRPDGADDTSEPECDVDEYIMEERGYKVKLQKHETAMSTSRKTMFHSEEVVTEVAERRCALWNPELSDFGVWDTKSCNLYEEGMHYIKCKCHKIGIVTLLAEMIPPAEVPEEPLWVTITKYVLYGISAILLILYIVVIMYSNDLKEQFHLMGLNLSVAVLLGSLAMCASDFDFIRDDRHLCTTFSTLIHFFYVAAGSWIACLGYASFRAITKGEVGGKLTSYAFISWGLALVSVGVPFTFFVKDLGTDPRCFVSWENYGKAAFFIPQMTFTLWSLFFGFVVICNLSTPALRKANLIDDYGSFCRGAAFVLIYFGITWVFGLLAYMRFGFDDPDFFPIFQITNSMMGIIIFVFIGLGSNRYRGVLAGQAKARREKLLTLAGGMRDKKGKKKMDKKKKDSDEESDDGSESDTTRPSTVSSLRPPSRGQVAGRPGSRPVTPNC